MSNFLKAIVLILVAGVVGIIFLLATEELKGREVGLLSIILTIFSILATWIVSHIYAESAHKKAIEEVKDLHQANLRMYALKAAEKVNNLSNQLSMLSVYLQEELDATDYDSPQEELLAKEERIASAIHITNTLKSVNDTALSDWKGVIGEELDYQREKKEEREEEIRDLLQDLQSLLASEGVHKQQGTDALRAEIESLRRELRLVATEAVGAPLRFPRKPKPTRETVETSCPDCAGAIEYKQRPRAGSYKVIKCPHCKTQLISRFQADGGFVREPRRVVAEDFHCPSCGAGGHVDVDTFPGSAVAVECEGCHERLRVIRCRDAMRVAVVSKAQAEEADLNDETIDEVKRALPPQPWPKNTSKNVAAKLQLPQSVVSRAITELIRRGVFKVQIDGTLYVPEPTDECTEHN